MTIKVALEHRTTYRFDQPITVHPHVVRLRPAPHSRTPVSSYSLSIKPENHFINWQQDAFGNYLARLVFPEPVRELDITVDLVADLTVVNPFDFFLEEYAERYPFAYPPALQADLEPYLRPVDEGSETGIGPRLTDWLAERIEVPDDGVAIVNFLVSVNQAVRDTVDYTVRMEPGVQTPDTTLAKALGSCRDSAWLLVSILRELGLAARFVSGYLVQLAADEPSLDGPSGTAIDFTDLHAWTEVYLPGAGWVGLDATSGLLAGEGHIPLSATPHPSSSAPISGAIDAAKVEFSFHNRVTRVHEDVRVTKPYSDEQWQRIDALGEHVDTLLAAGDVRLTMGGEPTFVSVDDASTPQWSTDADGDEKRTLAAELATALRMRWAPAGISHWGLGKWYPGEPLPRWQIGLTWRSDGEPLWRHTDLLGQPWSPGSLTNGGEVAERFARGVAQRLGVPDHFCLPAHEDRLHALWTAAMLPEGERPVDAEADAGTEVVDASDDRPGEPSGWVMPVFRTEDGNHWGTTQWRPRRKHLFLTPGSSPLGLRLPLSSLAWEAPPGEPDLSPFEIRPPFGPADPSTPSAEVLDIDDAPRTALCVEPRDGHLFVFLPPLKQAEAAIGLLAIVEATAVDLGVPVVLEGYPPPNDPRLTTLTVTPDPGVIEVNVQPSSSWSELRDLLTTLYADARATRLTTEKFDLDGQHTGTGGGNHLTLGGVTPADSPLLRRPDLLRSLITFWQHHPSLSYVFSGRFIGPTSQSPRVDEGRHETLYELEIAFAELDRLAAEIADGIPHDEEDEPHESLPWIVDRSLRHLLTDITGNTHRSEFCIDKLYSPDSERGRLGLLELRGFEMPPHPRMGLVQALLVRALVARFWAEPYSGQLVRWGSRLHDRFLLPAFATADLHDVVADLNAHLDKQHQFDPAWLDPFLEFRFPRIGEVDVGGVHLELRSAVEPWHVLGEEVSQGGTSRYVDSSVEKLQVAATGLVTGRHVVTCNGVAIPMVVDGVRHVGGVRYRAWAPYSALHPTIGVQSPLVFDVVDTWNERSLGGCTYHVVHPGGRSYERFPINAMEAEARRAGRFDTLGHSAGPMDPAAWTTPGGSSSEEYPCTLDLRRSGRMNP